MKRLISSVLLALVAVAAVAQTNMNTNTVIVSPVFAITSPQPITGAGLVVSSGTNQLAGSAATFYYTNTPNVSALYARNVTVSQQCALTTSGTGGFISYWNRSDGNIWVTNAYALTNTCAGTASVQNSMNIDMGGYLLLQLNYITNANGASAIATNWTITTSSKRGL